MMDFKFILGVLILILAVFSFALMQENITDSDLNETGEDTVDILMMDEDGNLEMVPTTDTYFEGSASAPG